MIALALTPLLSTLLVAGGGTPCPLEELHPTPPVVSPAPDQLLFGFSVATDGVRLAATAPGEYAILPDGSAFEFLGTVRIHERVGDAWVLEQKVLGPSPVEPNLYGWSCDIDGDTLLVGAPGGCASDCLINLPPGRVVFYERIAGTWTPVLETTASDASLSDTFGVSVELDGDRAVIGALHAKKAYVFERIGGVWTEVAILQSPPDTSLFGNEYGRDVALDGDVIAVGAPFDLTPGVSARGAVYVYESEPAGWRQSVRLVSPLAFSFFESFGKSVALSGETLAIGSVGASFGVPFQPVVNQNGGAGCGAVVVHTRGGGTWPLEALLGSSLAPATIEFGRAVALEGNDLLVGSSPLDTGRAELFRRGPLGWAPLGRMEPPAVPSSAGIELGASVALGGGFVAAGAFGYPSIGALLEGRVFAGHADTLGCAAQSLLGAPALVRLETGANHVLSLDAGRAHSGHVYLFLGSATGTTPGFPVGSILVPLVFDAYSSATLALANQPPFVQTFGFLDAAGRATAAVTLPPGLDPAFAGLALHHAALVLDPGPGAFTFASVAATLTLLP